MDNRKDRERECALLDEAEVLYQSRHSYPIMLKARPNQLLSRRESPGLDYLIILQLFIMSLRSFCSSSSIVTVSIIKSDRTHYSKAFDYRVKFWDS
jgi:hypothetical protein